MNAFLFIQSALAFNPYKIRVTPKESQLIQKLCFKYDIYWNGGCKDVCNTDMPGLYIGKTMNMENDKTHVSLTYSSLQFEARFDSTPHIEVKAQDIICSYQWSNVDIAQLKDNLGNLINEI